MISAPDLQKKTPNNPPIVPDYSAISRQHAEYLQAKGHLQQQENQYAEQSTLLKEQQRPLLQMTAVGQNGPNHIAPMYTNKIFNISVTSDGGGSK